MPAILVNLSGPGSYLSDFLPPIARCVWSGDLAAKANSQCLRKASLASPPLSLGPSPQLLPFAPPILAIASTASLLCLSLL